MIDPIELILAIKRSNIRLITGVPDSILKEPCTLMLTKFQPHQHIIAVNEGAAISLAIGHYLATNSPALVYMQNSGLGNAMNPLISLADPGVYAVPMILLVGWRGELLINGMQSSDEPQHMTQGKITQQQLETLKIPYSIADENTNIMECIKLASLRAIRESRPIAILVRKGSFAGDSVELPPHASTLPTRKQAIAAIANSLPPSVPIISSTGMISRELDDFRATEGLGHERDFLVVGGMGHAASVATGIALAKPNIPVVCLEGDGSMLMHLGTLTESGQRPNLIHVVLNNGCHDSVGGQPTAAARLDLIDIAKSCGYASTVQLRQIDEYHNFLSAALECRASSFFEVLCRRDSGKVQSRPKYLLERKKDFMRHLSV